MAQKNDNKISEKNRLEQLYKNQMRSSLKEKLGLKNIMEVPSISKIVLNVGIKTSEDSKAIPAAVDALTRIAGQKAVRTMARDSIASFKLREGMHIGAKVTLRGEKKYAFLDKLINLALPKVRDFQGISTRLDGRGNYNLGLTEWNIFPETDSFGINEKVYGLNITINTTAKNDEAAFLLLQELGMPFKKK